MAYKDKAMATKKQNEWITKTYDRINLTVPKGDKAVIQDHADCMGESANGFIYRAIKNQMEIDKHEQGK